MGIDVNIDDYSDEVLKDVEYARNNALIRIGMHGERLAKLICPVDTGRLRNSITWAIGGQPANIQEYKADRAKKGETEPYQGHYSGTAPGESSQVFIGSNVEYAQDVELGTSERRSTPYIKPAIVNHKNEYMDIIRDEFSKI